MPYTIELQLNRAAEAKFLKHWETLRAAGVSDLLFRLGYKPHVTLAMYREIDEAKTIAKLGAFVARETAIPVEFPDMTVNLDSIGCQPRENAALRRFHARFEKNFGKSFRDIDHAGTWKPHCTIGMELPIDRIGEAVHKLLASWRPIAGTLDRVALVKFRPGQVLWRRALQKVAR
jgi:2'-5' RNA ligase